MTEHKFLCGDSVHQDIVRKTEERVRAELLTPPIAHVLREHCHLCSVGGYFVCQHKVDAKVGALREALVKARAVVKMTVDKYSVNGAILREVDDALAGEEKPARLTAVPKQRHDDLTNLWRNYGEACRLENEGRANDGVSVREYEGELAAAFKELLDAAEVK